MNNIDRKIDYWKKNLLDLSQRNRLINCPKQKQTKRVSRTSIAINNPDAAVLWKLLVEENKPFTFPEENPYDNALKERQKTLRNLKTKARYFLEEKGIHVLHLAFGFKEWCGLRSPLLLVPVQLSQKDPFSPFVLSRHDDEIVHNQALSLKLFKEYNISLPVYSDEISLFEYLDKVQKICFVIKSTISLNVELSLFSFLKINMYQYINNHADKIKYHPVIRAIAGDVKSIDIGHVNVYGIDHDTIEPKKVFNIVDADSSQLDAILLAKRGISFVLQGPPGTGKSQTITNIIAELLSDGKTVLFVSEKAAALEVVQKRLAAAGLKGFCLVLNSCNAKRRDVLNQLEESMKLAQNKAVLSNAASLKLSRLMQQRTLLNDYPKELHTVVEPIGETIYYIIGKIASLNNAPDISFNLQNPETVTSCGLAERNRFLEDYSRIVAKKGYQKNNPWYGSTIKIITNQFRLQFAAEAENVINSIDSVILSQNNTGCFSVENLCYYDYRNCADYIELKKILKIEHELIEQKYTEKIFNLNGEELYKRCCNQYRSIFRYFYYKFWKDRNYIIDSLKISEKVSFADIKDIAERLYNIQSIKREIERLSGLIEKLNMKIETIAGLYKQLAVPVSWFSNMFEKEEIVFSKSLKVLRTNIINCVDNFSALENYIDYCDMAEKSKELGLEDFIIRASQADLQAEAIIPAFEKCFYNGLLDAILHEFTAVNKFRRQKQEDNIALFKKLDLEHIEISRAALISKLTSSLPEFDNFTSEHDEIGILKRELIKQRKLMPIRKLFASLPNLLPVLKPCMMMSPLSVSTYFGDSNYEFDTVIFDEASQIRTEDDICAISLAKQVIIAGDSKQLSPTDFFNVSASDENYDEDELINDDGAFESLLDEASLLPSKTLLWHYRSRHENLIAFSNANIYQGNLITFPSSVKKAEDLGVQYDYVSNGIYDRGGRNGNIAEAERIAELVYEHLYKYPERSLGIIAFGEVQQMAITEALLKKRKYNPLFEQYFNEDLEEPIFIKNLETVQGDERDTIIFSIGYAPDINGKFIMNFGPLSRSGGERRLNVAITRARYNVKLVGSINPCDIDLERITGEGPKLLKSYIDFAINGANAFSSKEDNALTEIPLFEKTIYDYLIQHGYEVEEKIGCSEYKIDMAVRKNNRYVIGIECDGAAYNSARTARERDRLRQNVLEKMGWKLYRVWSTDWIKDPKNEGKKLIAAIEEAMNDNCAYVKEESSNIVSISNYLDISNRQKMQSRLPRPKYYGHNANEIPLADFENVMYKIVSDSYGIDKEGLFKTTALCYGWQRRGDVIKHWLERAYQQLIRNNRVREVNGKIKVG